MHVAVNAHLLSASASYREAGVSRYIVHMLGALIEQNRADQWTIYAPPGVPNEAIAGSEDAAARVSIRHSRLNTSLPTRRIPWEQAIAPLRLRIDRPDVLLCPVNVAPLLAPCPVVVVVHDLAFLRLRLHKRAKRHYLGQFTRLSARKAAHVITVSQFTRQEAIELLGIAPERITAISNGLDGRFSPPPMEAVNTLRQREGLPERFILFVGTLEPRKNLAGLIEAYALTRARIGMPLIVVGGKGWLYHHIFDVIKHHGLESDVVFKGFVRDEDLPLYYAAATVLAYPSLYEGFGFPPLEAMAVGTPVVTSNAASLPEIVGDAALTVCPSDVGALADALVRAATDLPLRERLRRVGLQQAARFSWERAAEQTMQVLRAHALSAPASRN